MKLILHIGMGKTGSSAIQAALAANAQTLRARGVDYLGMWFDMLDPGFRGLGNQEKFYTLPPEEMKAAAASLVSELRRRAAAGLSIFVLSNEALSGKADALKPLIDHLRSEGIEVRAIGYARHPAAWLPSAHVQWSIRDKIEPGPVRPYGERARKLVRWYAGLIRWGRLHGEITEIRPYDRAADIVRDFAEAAELDLQSSGARVLERGDDAEILLRAAFNGRFPTHTLPRVFDRAVFPSGAQVPRLAELADRCFDYSETDRIIEENREMFDEMAAVLGFDPREGDRRPPARPDPEALRERLIDCLTEIVLSQAQRIQKLEFRLNKLEKRMDGEGDSSP